MAVAVATFPSAHQMSSVHTQSPQDALLDALLSSCEKPASLPLKSFGRDLKPYFPDANDVSTCILPASSTKKSKTHKANLQPVASAAAAAAASTKQPATKGNNTKAAPKKAAASKGKTVNAKNGPARTISPPASDNVLASFNSGDMAAFLSWAGPGFYVAPSPDKLPLPTALLLE